MSTIETFPDYDIEAQASAYGTFEQPPADFVDDLLAVGQLHGEAAEKYKAEIDAVVQAAQAMAVNENDAKLLGLAGEEIKWNFFGGRGEPLPSHLQMYEDYDTHVLVDYFEDDRDAYIQARQYLCYPYIDNISRRVWQELDSIAVEDLITEAVTSHPVYQLLSSFDVTADAAHERPLTQIEQLTKAAHIEAEERTKHGAEGDLRLHRGQSIGSTVARRTLRLNEEITIGQQEQEVDPLERLRTFFTEVFEATIGEKITGYEIGVTYNNSQIMLASGKRMWLPDAVDNASEEILRRFEGSDIRYESWPLDIDDAIGRALYTLMLNSFCYPNKFSYARYISIFKDDATYHFKKAVHKNLSGLETHTQAEMRNTPGKIMDRKTANVLLKKLTSLPHQIPFGFESTDGSEYIDTTRLPQDIGEVSNGKRFAGRLVMFKPRRDADVEETGETMVKSHLNILFSSALGKNMEPFIPGMKLLPSREGLRKHNICKFVLDEQADPYAPCEVKVPFEKVTELIDTYEAMGLSDLATKISQTKDITVSGLVNAIRSSSEYYEGTYRTGFYANNLRDFKKVVEDDKLVVQCTGAATFLHRSLDVAFGAGTCATIKGHLLKQNGVSGVGHVQVSFIAEGRQYLLDSTPASSEDDNFMLQATDQEPPLHGADAPKTEVIRGSITTADASQTLVYEKRPLTTEERQKILESNKQLLERHLCVVFDAHDREAMLRKVLALSEGDPIRRTMDFAFNARLDHESASMLVRLKEYTEQYAQTKPEDLMRFKLKPYEPALINLIQNYVRKVAAALQV